MKNDNLKTLEHPVNHNYRFAGRKDKITNAIHTCKVSLQFEQQTALRNRGRRLARDAQIDDLSTENGINCAPDLFQ